jgi:hypothetical protein
MLCLPLSKKFLAPALDVIHEWRQALTGLDRDKQLEHVLQQIVAPAVSTLTLDPVR